MRFKIKHIQIILVATFLVVINGSCRQDIEGFSHIPEIRLTNVEVVKDVHNLDSLVKITFEYQDGDGDIGFTDSDTFPPYNFGSVYQHNLWWEIFDVTNGQKMPVLDATRTVPENFNLRTPDLRPTGKIKQISGEMSVKVNAYSVKLYPDSIQCRLTLIDRSLNHSNTIETEVIKLVH